MIRRAGNAFAKAWRPLQRRPGSLLHANIVEGGAFYRIARGFFSNEGSVPFQPHIGVSKSYSSITNEKMEDFLVRNKIVHKLRPSGSIVVRECPFCNRPHQNKQSNLWTLNLKENNGAFLCFRCGTHGSWYDFVRFVLGDTINFDSKQNNDSMASSAEAEEELRIKSEKTLTVVEESVRLHMELLNLIERVERIEKEVEGSGEKNEKEKEDLGVLNNLETLRYLIGTENSSQRHLSTDTLRAYKIGIGEEAFKNDEGHLIRLPVVSFPLFRPTMKKGKKATDTNLIDNEIYDCVRAKVRGVGKENKHFQRFKPSGGHFGCFGLQLLKPDSKVGYK